MFILILTFAPWMNVSVPSEDTRLCSGVQEHEGFKAVHNKILSEVSQEQVQLGCEPSLFAAF